ncbi:B3 domain-containing transcription factor VRN1 isoform X2 [Ricinus communis]|uniref:B3 domain-containing transcription factor VRN1 isoform X2 n=1 Tax=Ricinus communis TaxID=3988 RepID=UPI00201A31B4|nr:B3 domain-containing transcription factor VRN1 isoform X2 [Ricinus communis]
MMERKPHFIKIILDDIIRDGKLRLPSKFVREHGNGMSSPVILEVPGGAVWKVELLECDGEVWLEKGWRELAEHYSLEYGHFLVFKYEENSHFHVLIFDKSGSEIEYPCNSIFNYMAEPNHDGELQNHKGGNADDSSIKMLDALSSCQKMGDKFPFLQSCQMRTDSNMSEKLSWSSIHACITTNTPISTFGPQSSFIKLEKSDSSLQELGGKCAQKMCIGSACEQATSLSSLHTSWALEAANNFPSKYPSFKVIVRQYHFRHSNVMPYRFFTSHIERKAENIMLQVADRMWPVKLRERSHTVEINGGWSAFSRSNSLKAGDVCVFELIKSNVLNVIIFRCGDQ